MPDILQPDDQALAEQQQLALFNENPESLSPTVQPGQVQTPPGQVIGQQNQNQLPDELSDELTALIEKYDRDEDAWRQMMLPQWKLLERFWEGQQHNVWSMVGQDWQDILSFSQEHEDDLDLEGYDPKTINVYRAYGESTIAALSSGIPATKFFPDDADSSDDVSTAKVYSRAAELIQRRNKAPYLAIKALYILWNQGVVGAYNYVREDPRLGTVIQPIHGLVNIPATDSYCPNCGYDAPAQQNINCPTCNYQGPPQVDQTTQQVPGVVGQQEIPRITEDIKLFSPLYFRAPHWITSQEETPYVGLDSEMSFGAVVTAFSNIKDIRDKVKATKDDSEHDRWARNESDYMTELVTVRQRWIRGWALEEIDDETKREQLKQMFPNGVYVMMAGDKFIDARPEALDDHWTISTSPVASHIYAAPLGKSVKDIQDMTNELVTMVLDNIEHGTPMAFVDSDMLNLQKFKESRTAPGMMYPVKVPPGQQIGNYIFETRPATLSEEVDRFAINLKEYGQFASGAYPSVYGGSPAGGSGTAREYVESRQAALQRLQITWKILNEFWTDMMAKAVKDYLHNLKYDERFVKPQGKNGYINVWIRKGEMTGRVGEVIAESSEKLPITWVQKQDTLVNMLQMKNPNIDAAVFHPENVSIVAETLGFPDFYIPGDDSRNKQLSEIIELLLSPPQMVMGPMGPMMKSTVPVDPDIDDHPIESETVKSFLISDTGQQIKKENPGGYANCTAHYKEHMQIIQMNQQAQLQMQIQLKGAGSAAEAQGKNSAEPNVPPPNQEKASA